MLFKSMSEEVTRLGEKIVTHPDGFRAVTVEDLGSLRGTFVKKSVTKTLSAGTLIPITRYTFTTSDEVTLKYGDILKRRDGSMLKVISKVSSPPRIRGSILRINQYLTEELDHDGRWGNI